MVCYLLTDRIQENILDSLLLLVRGEDRPRAETRWTEVTEILAAVSIKRGEVSTSMCSEVNSVKDEQTANCISLTLMLVRVK